MTAGSLIGVLSLLAWSQARELWQLYAVFVPLGVAMALTLYEPAFAILASWFARRSPRRALTVLTLFGGLASTVFTPLATWLLDIQGWRGALVTLALIVLFLAALPHAVFLRPGPAALAGDGARTPSDSGPVAPPSMSAAQAVRGAAFWLLLAAVVVSSFITMAINVHLIPYLLE
jgi:hypothetical protein